MHTEICPCKDGNTSTNTEVVVSIHHIMINFWTLMMCYVFCGWAQKQSVPLMAQGCLHRLRYLKLAEILSRLFHSLPGLWVPLWKGVFVPQLLHHLCQAAVGITASPNHLLPISVQVPELLPSGILLEPVFRILTILDFCHWEDEHTVEGRKKLRWIT